MLRVRLGVMVAATLLVALSAAAFLAELLFERQQDRALAELLGRELRRVERLMTETALGESFLDEEAESLTLQFVTADGRVAAPAGSPEALPFAVQPTMTSYLGAAVMVASAPWRLGGGVQIGTIRLAYDVEGPLATRRRLRSSLLIAAVVIAALSGAAGVLLVGRELRPLARLAQRAEALDPAKPDLDLQAGRDDEVGRVTQALAKAVGAIRRRQEQERDFVASVAHELGAPLTVVAGQLEALAERDADPRLLAARDAARELLHTSQDLLTLARSELSPRLELRVVSLAEVAERVAREYPGVRSAARGPGAMLGSPERLAQIVRNLVRNALEAGSAAGDVEVRVLERGGRVVLEVEDAGPGLDEEAKRRAFERYFTRRPGAGGHGLGLAVVKELAEAHGGELAVESEPGAGATFTLSFLSLEAQLSEGG